ncbi:hypothetical protein CEB3_c44570 [Peptococcaceae bacterium CEB3]|nr:hypothetical protein CEB3_c44570 [Peptococcaceae bacterium CEB3]
MESSVLAGRRVKHQHADSGAGTLEREFAPLLAIKDNYPKYVVTMDDFWRDNVDGVKHKQLAEFLLTDEF